MRLGNDVALNAISKLESNRRVFIRHLSFFVVYASSILLVLYDNFLILVKFCLSVSTHRTSGDNTKKPSILTALF